jgi:hypothetical protein
LHNVNREQEQFIEVFGEKVVPALTKSWFVIMMLLISIPAAREWYQIRAAIVGRKVESRGQQIIRTIFSFLTHSQQSTITDDTVGDLFD